MAYYESLENLSVWFTSQQIDSSSCNWICCHTLMQFEIGMSFSEIITIIYKVILIISFHQITESCKFDASLEHPSTLFTFQICWFIRAQRHDGGNILINFQIWTVTKLSTICITLSDIK